MTAASSGRTGPHPDLRQQICEAANRIRSSWPDDRGRLSRDFGPDDLTILGQRTWNDVVTINPMIDGGGISALLVSVDLDGQRYGGLVLACRKADDGSWGLLGVSFAENGGKSGIRGNMVSPYYQCIAFHRSTVGFLNNLHAVEIEYADGALHRANRDEDGCVIIFAPVERWEQKGNQVSIRYLDADGVVVHCETRWLGEGMGAPANDS